jgi:hypothetical protein
LSIRVPQWAAGATVRVNGQAHADSAEPGSYAVIEREWQAGDEIHLDLPMPPVAHGQVQQNTQESFAPDGSPVRQQVMHYEYVAVTRGPLVYASGLVDGYRTGETLRLSDAPVEQWLQVARQDQGDGPAIDLHSEGRTPLRLEPYYRAGGRVDGAWRLTWMSLAPGQDHVPPD